MSAKSLTAWLRGLSARDALLTAWQSAVDLPITTYETDALAAAARGSKTGTSLTVLIPSGRARLPLLAAVHAAALCLPGFPSPYSRREHGPVALVTRQIIRRAELAAIDAAGVPVSPALHPARLRADGLVAPLPGGRVVLQGPSHLLLLVGPSAGWATPVLPPTTVIVDAADEQWDFVADATEWATAFGATHIVFADVARRAWPPDDVVYPCGWSAIMAAETLGWESLSAIAPVRGHAVVLAAGARADLAAAAVLLADARRRGPLPPALIEASVLWRRLDELVVPLPTYDAACPRWHSPTLTERLEDLALMRASEFPRGWRTWAQTCWAGVKEGLVSARDALKAENLKAARLAEAVDADLRAGLTVDVALPSRTARDALTRHLAESGVPIPVDGRLILRSLADADGWGPPRATLLPAPPGSALRHRLVGADIGALNVLCYDHELSPLERRLRDALDEPLTVQGPVRRLLPRAVGISVDVLTRRPEVAISISTIAGPDTHGGGGLSHLADAIELAGLSALKMAQPGTMDADLPEADIEDVIVGRTADREESRGSVAALPLTVSSVSAGGGPVVVVHVPAHGTVARVLDGRVRRCPALDARPGMIVTALDGVTPFDRLRPLLLEARGPVARMLLTAWDQALTMALGSTGGPTGLAAALADGGAAVTASAVGVWADEERIGPQDCENVTRVGRLARHPVVADNGAAIAEVMRGLRLLHQAVGRAVAKPGETGAAEELERLLGPDAVSVLAETVVYRVLAVGEVITVQRNVLYATSPTASGTAGHAQGDEEDSNDR